LVPVGASVRLTSKNFVMYNKAGEFHCSTDVELPGTVFKNSTVNFVEIGRSTASTATCNWPEKGIPYEDFTLPQLVITKSGEGHASFSMKFPVPASGCIYTATNQPFTYTPGGSFIKFTGGHLEPNPKACGALEFKGEFRLEETAPTPGVLVID
jgi:hypothetical protein